MRPSNSSQTRVVEHHRTTSTTSRGKVQFAAWHSGQNTCSTVVTSAIDEQRMWGEWSRGADERWPVDGTRLVPK